VAVHPYKSDREPCHIGESLKNNSDPCVRVAQPMVRAGYLDNPHAEPDGGRGQQPFVPVSWPQALDLTANALGETWQTRGPDAIFGGSYGWASAGRFHHAQSQIHRFLNLGGGYVASVNSYSAAAAEVIIKHILGSPLLPLTRESPSPVEIAQVSKTVVLFGGAAPKNAQVNAGGLGAHSAAQQWQTLRDAGVRVINVSPIEDDVPPDLDAEWLACRPGSDTAIMLGMAYTLVRDGLHDESFLTRYTEGFAQFLPYLMGESDGVAKTPAWASDLSGVSADKIEELAHSTAASPSFLGISWSLQRQRHGEQSWWMVTTLGAMLGFIGMPGAGVGYGYGCIHNLGFGGRRIPNYKIAAFGAEIGERKPPRHQYIPVARISDMLENPGAPYRYNGHELSYPDIDLVYWAGGNPFHHHQDLNRLIRAWQKPRTIVINESVWTATARHADIVLPVTTFLERHDLGGSAYDHHLTPMHAALAPFAESRNDFDIFSGLAERLGFHDKFTEGRGEMEWIRHLYETTRSDAANSGVTLPPFEVFWRGDQFAFDDQLPDADFRLERFRRDPTRYPLNTPSGKIEIYSQTIASFGYDDCAGHAKWFDHDEWLGGQQAKHYPLHLVSNQPRHRLHSQLDHGVASQTNKINGREAARMNPTDARSRGLATGDIIRLYNNRGSCLAGLQISECIMPGVIELPTGAWFDPQDWEGDVLEVHGNPNVLTPDVGTSSLAQGCSAHTCLVEVEKFTGEAPTLQVFQPPKSLKRQ
ncbi:MAG: molybdopterin-dependent oxidoreductase, partial [Cellvibrionales bacterium]